MKVALHVHTSLSDGLHSPADMVAEYEKRGFGAVAITDHGFMTKPDYYEFIRKIKSPAMVLAGIEIDFEPWNYNHLIRIHGEDEVLHILCHPRAYFLEVREVNQRIRSAPFPIDAVEITHRGFYTAEYDVAEIPVPKIASDDAHESYDVGRAWIETRDTKDPDQLIRAIKAGEFRNGFLKTNT
jgi:predicted metal-dependent phosphoesterase TrpH